MKKIHHPYTPPPAGRQSMLLHRCERPGCRGKYQVGRFSDIWDNTLTCNRCNLKVPAYV